MRLKLRIAVAAVLALVFSAGSVLAGGGPENVLLVVNRRSWASVTVANHYIRLRGIPAQNVVNLDWPGSLYTDIETFRRDVLLPALATIDERQLEDHIDYVVYSSDFPTTISAHGEMKLLKLPPYMDPSGSLTGLTYLWSMVCARRPDWVALNSNYYVRPERPQPGVPATHGFHSWYGWSPDGALLEAGGRSYMLSTALAVTSGRGNSLAEIIDYLSRSAAADGTRPSGTIYFDQTSDIRSKCREPQFAPAADELKQLGVRAEIIPEPLPKARSDVQGVMAGLADFSWPKTLSRILPGAICEHLTSTAGMLNYGGGQTPLTEWLRYGAAGSSGTVAEPYLLQAKFPLPQMHVHYARGSSLAEAYYQAVAAPFQLLIVGDPLCQPWARRPQITLSGLESAEPLAAKAIVRATTSPASADRVHWFIDGRRIAITAAQEPLELDPAMIGGGQHELRAVVHDNGDIETQNGKIVEFSVAGRRRVELTASTRSPRWDQPLSISCQAPGASSITVYQHTWPVMQISNSSGTAELSPQVFGLGPVRLVATAQYPDGAKPVRSKPLDLDVSCGPFMPAIERLRDWVAVPGFDLTIDDGEPQVVSSVGGEDWLASRGGAAGKGFSMAGVLYADADDVYQLQIRFHGSLKCEVDGRLVFSGDRGDDSVQYVPVPLATGWHRLRLFGVLGEGAKVGLAYGHRGIMPLGPEMLQRLVAP